MSLCLGHPQPHPCGHAWISTPTALWLCLGLTPCGMPGPATTAALSFYLLLPPCVYAWATTTVLWLCLGHPLPQPCRYAWDAHYNRPVPIPRPPTTAALSLCLGLALPCGYTHYHRTDAWATHHRSPTALWLCLGSSAQLYRYAWATHYHSPVAMPRPTRLQHSPGYA